MEKFEFMENWNKEQWRYWKATNEFIKLGKLKKKAVVDKAYEEKVIYEFFDSAFSLKEIQKK